MSTTEFQLQALITAARLAYAEEPDPIAMEHHYEKILDFIVLHSSDQEDFINVFVEMVENPKEESISLIEYCMHELRWEDVRLAAQGQREVVERSLAKRWMENIIKSFTDQWHGTAYYDRFMSN